MTALALRDDQNEWDAHQLAALRGTGIDEDVTEAELMVFLHECQRRKLDPFTRQIYLLGRWDRKKKRKVYRSQTGIDGFRVVARRAADEARQTIEYEETLWCGPDRKWTDVWLDSEPPAACKIVVLRDGKRFPAIAKFSSYVQVNDDGAALGLWRKMADNQLAKCTEALALRKAFPEDLGGLYTEEEMGQADNPQRVTATAEVIRDEPPPAIGRQGNGGAAADSRPWAEVALKKARTFKTDSEADTLYHEAAARHKAGEIDREAQDRIQNEIAAEVTARHVKVMEVRLNDLSEHDDDWRDRIRGLANSREARELFQEVGQLKAGGVLDPVKAGRLGAAIIARWPRAVLKDTEAAA